MSCRKGIQQYITMVETRVVCIMTFANGVKTRSIVTNAEALDLQFEHPAGVTCVQLYAYGSKLARRYPWGSC